MSEKVIDAFFQKSNPDTIVQLIATGGETSLPQAARAYRYLIHKVIKYGVNLYCSSVITNGQKASRELALTSELARNYCLYCYPESEFEPYMERGAQDWYGEYFSGIYISDRWYQTYPPKPEVVDFYRQKAPNTFREPIRHPPKDGELLYSALAEQNGFKCRPKEGAIEALSDYKLSRYGGVKIIENFRDSGCPLVIVPSFHMSTNGDVVPGLGYSHKLNHQYAMFNVAKEGIVQALMRHDAIQIEPDGTLTKHL